MLPLAASDNVQGTPRRQHTLLLGAPVVRTALKQPTTTMRRFAYYSGFHRHDCHVERHLARPKDQRPREEDTAADAVAAATEEQRSPSPARKAARKSVRRPRRPRNTLEVPSHPADSQQAHRKDRPSGGQDVSRPSVFPEKQRSYVSP